VAPIIFNVRSHGRKWPSGGINKKEGMSAALETVREQIVALLPRLRRFARTLADNAYDADDLVQIAIARALDKHSQLHDEASIAGSMFGITKDAWVDEVRARTRRENFDGEEDAGMAVSAPAAETQSAVLAVEEALLRLPDEQRLAVALVLIEGLSYQQAAGILEIPVGTVTTRLTRARAALQEMLQGAATPGGAQ
jgi:RNA polymerase sigma-70 factor (ECF subfamily)